MKAGDARDARDAREARFDIYDHPAGTAGRQMNTPEERIISVKKTRRVGEI